MYIAAQDWQQRHGKTIDAVLQVGDFETIRNPQDFEHYYAPQKFHHISDIAEYCKGLKRAPFFTVFIGGNHEAWSVLKEHRNGGFICPEVYFLGRANVIDVNGVKIGGLTGIFNRKHYRNPLPEQPGYDWKFYREEDVKKLEQRIEEEGRVDVLLLHDWVKPYSAIEVQEESQVPVLLKRSAVASPTLCVVQRYHPQHLFMGHRHISRVEGRIGVTEVHALTEFRGDGEPYSFKVVEVTPEPSQVAQQK